MSKMFHTMADLSDLDAITKSNKERLRLLNILPKEQKAEIEVQTDVQTEKIVQILPKEDSLTLLNLSINKYIQEVDQYNKQHQQNLEELINKIKATVRRVLNQEAYVYGSFATELSLPNSDIDIVIMTAQTMYIVDQMKKLEIEFSKTKFIEETKCILFTAIPVLKLKSVSYYFNKRIDISFQEPRHNGIQCVSLIKSYLNYLPELRPLTMVLKQFLSQSSLLDPYQGGLSSYGLNLMIISFLQSRTGQQLSLGQCLVEFLYLYGCEMDYIAKTIYVFLPDQQISAYPIYFNPQNAVNQIPTLLIQDPLNEKHNVGRPTYNIQAIKFIFAVGFMKALNYQSDQIDDFLSCGKDVQLKLESHIHNFYQQ
ncbi:unnamed protein product [Paramecium octaurelia]|uniref:Poly(A) RNA polymerase mitochondrial-like central palm domain-containing protein n=1 Tax=Paramecium octaurelia TaxID=43137 RepID=A0A8S1XFT0_PAROT|nr:unnamed protein product [Paramecium octaurelia]